MKLEEERALREQRRLSGEPSRQEKEFRAFARGLLVNCTSQGALLSRLAPDMLVEGSEAEERLIRASFPFLPALSANPNRSAWRSTDGDSFRSQRHGSLHDSACSVSNSSPRVASPTRPLKSIGSQPSGFKDLTAQRVSGGAQSRPLATPTTLSVCSSASPSTPEDLNLDRTWCKVKQSAWLNNGAATVPVYGDAVVNTHAYSPPITEPATPEHQRRARRKRRSRRDASTSTTLDAHASEDGCVCGRSSLTSRPDHSQPYFEFVVCFVVLLALLLGSALLDGSGGELRLLSRVCDRV